jgi:hypothetical protein
MGKPCPECPFKRTAPAGWLGPYRGDAKAFIADTWQEEGMRCHMAVATVGAKAPLCTGSLICVNNSFKRYRDPAMQEAQDAEGKDHNIMNAWEFIKHHEGEAK